jgi:predicted RNA-binding protein associated with RNAse of E/G family
VCGGVMEVWVEVIDPLPPPGWVDIHYLRPPDRLTVFRQELVHEGEDGMIVTLARAVALPAPLRAGGEVILDPGAPALWFTFPGVPHDIGRFHRADGSFTGWYANLLTPVVIEPGHVWRTTDLRLDVWLPEGAAHPLLLDEDELAEAVDAGWIDPAHAALARDEAVRIMIAAATGSWPPPIAREWTLERALDRLAGG